ncbi:MAG: DMT family transporter [Burkholderiaceae bacterium]|nr:DMT family transporter [Burkholderiaceae bacterium]
MSATGTLQAPDAATRGLAWGALGVLIFALTLPMTRLAVGDASAPQLPPAFVTAGRAALAGLLAAAYLLATGARRPPRATWGPLALSACGTVLGFPLGLALALRDVPSAHAAVVTGVLPLATAVVGAVAGRHRPSAGFWAAAGAGCALVLAFAVWQGGGALVAADAWLAMAVATGAVGYVAGARAGAHLPAPQVISWVLVGALPLTLPAAAVTWPDVPVSVAAWGGFAYTAVFSMWLGFFAWYHGLALGGVLRVSQVQLLQPFLAIIAAALLLGEALELATVAFALAVLAVVALGRRTRIA